MTETDQLIAEANSNGLRLTFVEDAEQEQPLAILLVGAAQDGNDVVLATTNWLEELPSSFPLHRLSGPVRAVGNGWQLDQYILTPIRDDDKAMVRQRDAYRANLRRIGKTVADLVELLNYEIAGGHI